MPLPIYVPELLQASKSSILKAEFNKSNMINPWGVTSQKPTDYCRAGMNMAETKPYGLK